jgi:hypothetical protein
VSNEAQHCVATRQAALLPLHMKALTRNATMRLHISPQEIRDVIMLNNSMYLPSSGTEKNESTPPPCLKNLQSTDFCVKAFLKLRNIFRKHNERLRNKNKPSHPLSATQTSYIHTERNKGSDRDKKEKKKQWRK